MPRWQLQNIIKSADSIRFIVFDDLSTHAKFLPRIVASCKALFRERDSYPGDIFLYTFQKLARNGAGIVQAIRRKGSVAISLFSQLWEIVEGGLNWICFKQMSWELPMGHILF